MILDPPETMYFPPKEKIFIPTDIMTQMQTEFHGIILSRLGPALNSHVHTAVGLVDGDYRGNIGILLYNLHQHMPFHVARGMRIAQIIFQTNNKSYICKGSNSLLGPKCLVQE